jgi:hypothetical protein
MAYNKNFFQAVVEPQLKNAKTAGQMLEVLNSAYDLSKPMPSARRQNG